MHLPHSSIANHSIVQAQHLPHVTPNSGKDRLRHPAKTNRSQKKEEAIMAYVNTTRAASTSVSDRFANLFAGFSAMVARRRIYDRTVRELASLTDRELSDLGIARSLIGSIAREAAYGK